jgi:ornithine cyclodeaminase
MARLGVGSNDAGNDNDNYSAQVCIKSGYVTGDPYFVVKVATGGHPLPNNTGLMQVYLQSTARLEALLLDEGILTELRTAAAGAVDVKYVGPATVNRIGIVGTGIQARYQLRFLKHMTTCRHLLIWGRTREKASALKEVIDGEWDVRVADLAQELLQSCNIIVTTTCSQKALLEGPVVGPLLIECIGADTVGKQELSTDLPAGADCLVCDTIVQTQERGEFQRVVRIVSASMLSLSREVLGSTTC